MPTSKDPQRVTFATDGSRGLTEGAFTSWLCQELQGALDARARWIADGGLIDTAHALYEQAERPRSARPWADAADLASYIPTEKIDSLRARLAQAVFGADPICTVEGWGEPAERVAKAEAFHQWKAEDERLQTYIVKAIHVALIEGTGVLEVDERHGLKKSRGPFKAAVKQNEWRQMVLDPETMQPTPDTDESGAFVPWSGNDDDPYVEITRETVDYFGRGPAYRVLSLKDFVFLPGHAEDNQGLWGYARRIYKRLPDLEQQEQAGVYRNVAALGTAGEREARQEHARQGITIASQEDSTAEKELWEVQLLKDIDGDGIEEWLVACVSLKHTTLLRCDFDSLEQVRYVAFTPYPRYNSVYGYSFLLHKLWTITEEHTALRNMKADRQSMANGAPITRLSTSIWDPDDQPWGPFAVLDVRSHDDIRQVQIADVPSSTYQSEQTILGAAERVTGLNDAAVSGVQPDTKRTATEIGAVSQASFVRIEEPIRHIQESLEDLYQLRNALWARALANDEQGLLPPERVLTGLLSRNIALPDDGSFRFTSADLQGSFKFKPKGSVETADKGKLRADFAEFLSNALPTLMKMFPQQAATIMQNPNAFRELLDQALRLYGFQSLQAITREQPTMASPPGLSGPGGPPPSGLPPMLAGAMPGILAQLQAPPPGA
jgi:hypothetical protein